MYQQDACHLPPLSLRSGGGGIGSSASSAASPVAGVSPGPDPWAARRSSYTGDDHGQASQKSAAVQSYVAAAAAAIRAAAAAAGGQAY
jgi:hypothetical protein